MRRSREEWSQVVEAFERSGRSHEAFCAQHHINVGSFRVCWRETRFRRDWEANRRSGPAASVR